MLRNLLAIKICVVTLVFVRSSCNLVTVYLVHISNFLLIKLKSYGITDDLLKWIENFLCNRKQRVGVNGKFSKWFKVMSGIPQEVF